MHLDPANFGPHGRQVAQLTDAPFGDQMQAFLTNCDANDQSNSHDIIEDLSDTPTLRVALTGPEKHCWIDAIHSELDNIKAEDVYDLVDPSDQNIDNLLGNKIVL